MLPKLIIFKATSNVVVMGPLQDIRLSTHEDNVLMVV